MNFDARGTGIEIYLLVELNLHLWPSVLNFLPSLEHLEAI
jgi:hypothetical protein